MRLIQLIIKGSGSCIRLSNGGHSSVKLPYSAWEHKSEATTDREIQDTANTTRERRGERQGEQGEGSAARAVCNIYNDNKKLRVRIQDITSWRAESRPNASAENDCNGGSRKLKTVWGDNCENNACAICDWAPPQGTIGPPHFGCGSRASSRLVGIGPPGRTYSNPHPGC